MSYPANYRFTREHEWVGPLENGRARIGITDYAQQQLGDIVFVELPAVDSTLTAGQAFGTVESVKAVSEVFAPVGGKVVAVNPALAGTPELVNLQPHTGAWLIEAQVSDPRELEKLMDTAAYEAFVASDEAHH